MLSWAIQVTIISIVLILLVHHLIHFFKSTLTVPKIKDLVNTSPQKYEHMYNIINQHQHQQQHQQQKGVQEKDFTLIDLLPTNPPADDNNMKAELKHFLKSQLHSTF